MSVGYQIPVAYKQKSCYLYLYFSFLPLDSLPLHARNSFFFWGGGVGAVSCAYHIFLPKNKNKKIKKHLHCKDASCLSKVMSDLGMYAFQNSSTNITQMF